MLPCFRGSGNPDERLHGSDGDPFRTLMIVPASNVSRVWRCQATGARREGCAEG